LRFAPAESLAKLVPKFDAYRIGHPRPSSGYRAPICRSVSTWVSWVWRSDAGLIDRVNAALESMLEDGEAESLAVAAYMTYLPPRQPYVLDGFRIGDLTKFE
jgi:hypothetical protein